MTSEKFDLMTEMELAATLGLCKRTIIRWRMARKGPPHVQMGRSVRYRKEDVKDWLERSVIDAPRMGS